MKHVMPMWVDVTEFVARQEQPVVLVARTTFPATSKLWVPTGDVFGDPKFAMTRAGEVVRVPILAYRTKKPAQSDVFGLGLQIGLAAASALYENAGVTVEAVLPVIGHTVDDLRPADQAMRVYIGMVLQTR